MLKRKLNKKGFTLVEIIVVLVIIAILAAAAIPTMLGFVNDARGKAFVAEARAAYVAAQYLSSEAVATNQDPDTAVTFAKINSLAGGLTGTISDTDGVTIANDGKVTSLVYVAGGKTITINAGGTVTVE